MEAKLIKTFYGYELLTQGFVKGSTNHELIDSLNIEEGNIRYKLSLKNCQAIENGYDLDELAKEKYPYEKYDKDDLSLEEQIQRSGCFLVGHEEGLKKALEILGDKKFSLEQVMEAIDMARETENFNGLFPLKYTPSSIIQSLQQTEWSVEIVMRPASLVYISNLVIEELDADGCIILKRK